MRWTLCSQPRPLPHCRIVQQADSGALCVSPAACGRGVQIPFKSPDTTKRRMAGTLTGPCFAARMRRLRMLQPPGTGRSATVKGSTHTGARLCRGHPGCQCVAPESCRSSVRDGAAGRALEVFSRGHPLGAPHDRRWAASLHGSRVALRARRGSIRPVCAWASSAARSPSTPPTRIAGADSLDVHSHRASSLPPEGQLRGERGRFSSRWVVHASARDRPAG